MRWVVWVDELFFNNLFITLLILWATARLSGCRYLWWRLFLSAAMGSVYTVMTLHRIFQAFSPALQILLHFLLSLLLVRLAFMGPRKKILLAFGYLYLITFILGGAVVGSYYLLGGSSFPQFFRLYRGDLWVILLGILFLGILGHMGFRFIHHLFWQGMFHFPLTIHVQEKQVSLQALLDTGNRLVDPINQEPVIIVEWQVLEEIFPQEVPLLSLDNFMDFMSLLEESHLSSRLRIIPFGALHEEGILLGIRPDRVVLEYRGQEYSMGGVIVAPIFKPLDENGQYQALLHPEIYQSLIGGTLNTHGVKK